MTIPFFGIPKDWYSNTELSINFVSVTAHFIICRADLLPPGRNRLDVIDPKHKP